MEADAPELARAALARGHTVTAAAAIAGVSRQTLHDWMRQDDSLRKARDLGCSLFEEAIIKDATADGKLALDVLSRRKPKDWGRKDHLRVDATMKAGAPKSREEAEAQCAAMMAAFAKDAE